MITAEQLKAEHYKECWFNVYADHSGRLDHIIGFAHYTKADIDSMSKQLLAVKPLYRIHVRLK